MVIFIKKNRKPIAIKFWHCYTTLARNSALIQSTPALRPHIISCSRCITFSCAYTTSQKGGVIRKGGERLYNFPDAFLMRKFVNLLMVAGKKGVAYKMFCAAGFEFLKATERDDISAIQPTKQSRLKHLKRGGTKRRRERAAGQTEQREEREKFKVNRFLSKLHTVIRNVQPSVEGKKCRVGGSNKLVPAIVSYKRGYGLAIRWIIESARKKKKGGKLPMHRYLAQEFVDAHQRVGRPRQRRDELHKLCEENRGFLRYRWW